MKRHKFILEDRPDFGFVYARPFIATNKKAKLIHRHAYIKLKRKAYVGNGDMFLSTYLYAKKGYGYGDRGVYVDNNGFDMYRRANLIKTKAKYQVTVVHSWIVDNYYISTKRELKKILAKYKALVDIGSVGNKVEISGRKRIYENADEEAKIVVKNMAKGIDRIELKYWYKSSYEYDEYDLSTLTITVKKLNYKKGA